MYGKDNKNNTWYTWQDSLNLRIIFIWRRCAFKRQQKSKSMNKQILPQQMKCSFFFCFSVEIPIGNKAEGISFLGQISLFSRPGDLPYCGFPLHLETGLYGGLKGNQPSQVINWEQWISWDINAMLCSNSSLSIHYRPPLLLEQFSKYEWLSFQL